MRSNLYRHFVMWLIVCAGFVVTDSHAAIDPLLVKLSQSNYRALDAELNQLQAVYERDHSRADQLRYAFMAFSSLNPDLDGSLSAWVAASPKSYAAHLARAIYLYEQGARARGDDWISNTPASNIEQMNKLYALSKQDLMASINLTPQPLLSYEFLIQIGSNYERSDLPTNWLARIVERVLNGDAERKTGVTNADWLAESIKFDPANYWVRHAYLLSLRPQWGGSIAAMHDHVADTGKYPLSVTTRHALEAQLVRADARPYRLNGDYPTAINLYTKALRLYEEADAYVFRGICYHLTGQATQALADFSRAIVLNPRWASAYSERGGLLMERKDYAGAFNDYLRLTELDPDNAVGWNFLGWIKYNQGLPAEAVPYYARSVALGDDWAQSELGSLYANGNGVPKDIAKARSLWKLSAKQGNEEAIRKLREVLK